MLVESYSTGRTYNPHDVVRLVNTKQVCFYMKHGVELVDIYPSKDFKTNEDILVFVVNKHNTQEVYKMWMDNRNG